MPSKSKAMGEMSSQGTFDPTKTESDLKADQCSKKTVVILPFNRTIENHA